MTTYYRTLKHGTSTVPILGDLSIHPVHTGSLFEIFLKYGMEMERYRYSYRLAKSAKLCHSLNLISGSRWPKAVAKSCGGHIQSIPHVIQAVANLSSLIVWDYCMWLCSLENQRRTIRIPQIFTRK